MIVLSEEENVNINKKSIKNQVFFFLTIQVIRKKKTETVIKKLLER